MDLYISSMVLGAIGFTAMALGGLGSRGGGHHGGAHGHGGTTGHVHGVAHGHSHAGAGHAAHAGHAHTSGMAGRTFWLITSPRFLFSLMLGFGATGAMLHSVLPGPALLAAAAVGAVAFERFLVTPLWNFAMRFASRPASTLESAVADEAIAVSAFDDNGQGIVSLEVDGQVLQILATLQPQDRVLGGRVRAGQRLRID